MKISLLAFSISCFFFSAEAVEVPHCHITVKQVRKSEEESVRTFSLPLKSKEACLKAAKLHETNFNPKVIKKVEVSTKWDGK